MFHVKTKLKESKIHGIGLFAEQDIPKGTLIYSRNENLDINIPNSELSKLSKNEADTIKHYGYFDQKSKKWHLSFDDIRFCNHKKESNIENKHGKLYARKNISKGEELTDNYTEFEDSKREGLID